MGHRTTIHHTHSEIQKALKTASFWGESIWKQNHTDRNSVGGELELVALKLCMVFTYSI